MNDLLLAYNSNFALKRTDFDIKPRSKKKHQVNPFRMEKEGRLYPKSFGEKPIAAAEELPDKLPYDSRLKHKQTWPISLVHSPAT